VLNAGSTAFTITGTDSIKGPSLSANSSNFSITDNALMTWKQAVLGKRWFSVDLTHTFQAFLKMCYV